MAFPWNLKNFTSRQLFEDVIINDETCIEWMRAHNLLARVVACPACNSRTTEGYLHEAASKKIFRCANQQCRRKIDYRINSFFKSNIPVKKLMHFVYLWSKESPLYVIHEETGLGHTTLVDWCNFMRDICYQKAVINAQPLGGAGVQVELDESKFVKRKYNVGRLRPNTAGWVFGGIERHTRRCFLLEVPRRDANTLLPIIQARVLPGTTIMTDEWAAYRGLTNLGYNHQTVNHSVNFINPATGCHTQNVESMWARAKATFRRIHGTSMPLRSTYLNEFVWRSEYGKDAFHNILQHIAEIYRV